MPLPIVQESGTSVSVSGLYSASVEKIYTLQGGTFQNRGASNIYKIFFSINVPMVQLSPGVIEVVSPRPIYLFLIGPLDIDFSAQVKHILNKVWINIGLHQ